MVNYAFHVVITILCNVTKNLVATEGQFSVSMGSSEITVIVAVDNYAT